jgi:hypothetical protein
MHQKEPIEIIKLHLKKLLKNNYIVRGECKYVYGRIRKY